MIIKSLSRSNKDGIGKLVKYIAQIHKISPSAEIALKYNEEHVREKYFTHGVPLSKNDLKHLHAEKDDAKLLKEWRAMGYDNIEQFIENQTSGKSAGVAKVQPFIFTHNLRGDTSSLKDVIQQFEKNEEGRIRKTANQVAINHIILSFNSKGAKNITDGMLVKMAEKFSELRGENNMYAFSKHMDKEHIHIHIAMSATSLNGRSSRISKEDFSKLKIEMDRFQELNFKKELSNSFPNHQKGKRLGREEVKNKKILERSSIKNSLQGCIERALTTAKSTEQFIGILKENNFSAYYRAGRLTGAQSMGAHDNVPGLKFRFSRLVPDLEDKLKQLDTQHTKEEQALQQLREIRNGRGKEREKDKAVTSRIIDITVVGAHRETDGIGKGSIEADTISTVTLEGQLKTMNETDRQKTLQVSVNHSKEFERRQSAEITPMSVTMGEKTELQKLRDIRERRGRGRFRDEKENKGIKIDNDDRDRNDYFKNAISEDNYRNDSKSETPERENSDDEEDEAFKDVPDRDDGQER